MIRTVFWIFIFILALSFFGISIQAIIESPAGQANVHYLLDIATSFWHWLSNFVLSFNMKI